MTDEITSDSFGSAKSTWWLYSEGERAWSGRRTWAVHAGPQGHLYRAEEAADEPVVELGFIAINGHKGHSWHENGSQL